MIFVLGGGVVKKIRSASRTEFKNFTPPTESLFTPEFQETNTWSSNY